MTTAENMPESVPTRHPMRRAILKRLIAYPPIVYGMILIMLLLMENSIIYPAPKFPMGFWQERPHGTEDARFQAEDGTLLHGWFIPHDKPRGTLLVFHGNGENVSHLAYMLGRLNAEYQLQVLAFDYRGYGHSAGSPSEAGLRQDARAALEWLNTTTNTQPDDVIYYGRSLGGGVAVELAAERGCRALVLESTFSSMPDAASTHYPWLPVQWLMRNRFPSETHLQHCPQPLLQTHGNADRVIPFWSGRRLFEASPSKNKRFIEIDGADHNDGSAPVFWEALGELLDQLDPQPASAP